MNDKQGDFTQDVQELNSTMQKIGESAGEACRSLQANIRLEDIASAADRMAHELTDLFEKIYGKHGEISDAIQDVLKTIRKSENIITKFISGPTWTELKQLFPDSQEWLAEMANCDVFTYGLMADVFHVLPELMPEIKKYRKKNPAADSLKQFLPLHEVERPLEIPPSITLEDYQWPSDAGFIVCLQEAQGRWKREKAEALLSNLPVLPANNVIENFMNVDTKVTQDLFNSLPLPRENITLEVGEGGNGQPTLIQYSALIDRENITTSIQLDSFDRIVLNAAFTLYAQGDPSHIFNEKHILQTCSGHGFFQATGEKIIEKIHESLEKMRCTIIEIHAENQIIQWQREGKTEELDRKNNFVYQGYLLPLESLSARDRNGNVSTAYMIMFRPALLRYAEAIGQIVTYPHDTLQSFKKDGKPLSATSNNIVLNHYIRQRISIMKNKKDRKRKKMKDSDYRIRYQTIYAELGEEATKAKTQKARIRDTIETIFESLKNSKEIKNYIIHYRGEGRERKGTTPESIEVVL